MIPESPGVLADGGRLQMMAVTGQAGYLASCARSGAGRAVTGALGRHRQPRSPNGRAGTLAVFNQGLAEGAARFARLDGAFSGDGGIYVVSTNEGDALAGQVFHCRPTSAEPGS